jgi:hypothetical protein
MKQVIKGVVPHEKILKSLSSWWEKITLIGKINSFEVASTILDDMDNTQNKFNGLQIRLIESLVNENSRKFIVENSSRSQMAIDVLIRNLFERTADIGFLSTDHDVTNFLQNTHKNKGDIDFIQQRLQAYINIYSVYKDAFLLTADSELVFQLSQPSRIGKISDDIIQQALNKPSEYVEYFGETELIEGTKPNLLYANAVVNDGKVVGVIVLCFRFNNEVEGIINRLLFKNENDHFLLSDGTEKLLRAPNNNNIDSKLKLTLATKPKMHAVDGKDMIEICVKGQAYQDYAGPKNWYMGSLLPIEQINYNVHQNIGSRVDNRTASSNFTEIISEELFDIRRQSVLINDDLQLIVLNGIITAARQNAVEFMPVLEAIKKIGKDISDVFSDSIESLFSTIVSGQLNAMRLQASLAVDIMDRNLYERANDCRWWGVSSLLRKALSSPVIDKKTIKETLATIHSLYTVYHTLYVYDKEGRYVAFSDEQYNEKIGQNVSADSGAEKVFKLNGIYEYNVSPFEKFDCYQGAYTYIYNAAIRDMDQENKIVGGIGIVFDSTTEFKAILNDILPRENGIIKSGAKALFTTEQGTVLSSSSDEHSIGDVFYPDIDKTEFEKEGTIATFIRINDKDYLISGAKSVGYREYKCDDGYNNVVIAWVLSPC